MVNVMKTRGVGSNTSTLICPINKTAILMCEDAEPLPSMFRRSHANEETEPRRSNGKARFSPYIIALVLLTFAPAQAALLTSSFPIDSGEAIEDVLALAKQGAAEIAALLTMPSAAKRDSYSVSDMD